MSKKKEYSKLIQKDIYNVLNSDNTCPEIPDNFINAIDFLWKKEPIIKKEKRGRRLFHAYNLKKRSIYRSTGFAYAMEG